MPYRHFPEARSFNWCRCEGEKHRPRWWLGTIWICSDYISANENVKTFSLSIFDSFAALGILPKAANYYLNIDNLSW